MAGSPAPVEIPAAPMIRMGIGQSLRTNVIFNWTRYSVM
jgi:hypothetical protein